MSASLESIEAKINRANQNLADLYLSLIEWASSAKDLYSSERDDKPEGQTVRLIAKAFKSPSIGCQVLIGDVVHCLRSSLDYLVYQLAIKQGHKLRDEDRTAFPICGVDNSESKRTIAKATALLDAGSRTAIEALQPHRTAYALSHPLWVLNKLDNIAKHRVIIAVNPQILVFSIGGDPVANAEWKTLKDGAEIARVPCSGDPQSEVDVKANLRLRVEFKNTGVCDGWTVIPTLTWIRGEVVEAINTIAGPHFPLPRSWQYAANWLPVGPTDVIARSV